MATGFLNFVKHAVAGSSKLKATICGHIYNIQAAADIDNGCIVGKGAYVAPEYYAEAAATTFTGKIIEKAANGNWYVEVETASNAYLVLTVPMIYEQYTKRMQDESNFYNAKGDLMRCYELVPGDIFELSDEGFDGTPVKGKSVTVNAKKVKVGA